MSSICAALQSCTESFNSNVSRLLIYLSEILLTYKFSPQASPSPSVNASKPASCAGSTYNIKPSDDCYCISKEQKIGTSWLLTDNNLQAYCANFPKNGTLCLVNKCDVYTLKSNDTCTMIAKEHKITESQLRAWNPVRNRSGVANESSLTAIQGNWCRLLQSC